MVRFISDTSDANLSARGPQMRVIGAGLSRSATSSLQAAFESPVFGFTPCMHMAHVVPHTSREQIIIDATLEEDVHVRRKMLHQIFDGYQAATDYPTWWFIDDMMDMYPDALIVLNQRGGGGVPWSKSLQGSIGFFWSWTYLVTCALWKTDRLHWRIHQVTRQVWSRKWKNQFSPEFYDEYQAFVLAEANKRGRQVLIWKAEDGWGPLCKFLDKEPPKDEPFPWVNDAADMTMLKRILVGRGLLSWAALFGGVYATWRFWPSILMKASKIKNAMM